MHSVLLTINGNQLKLLVKYFSKYIYIVFCSLMIGYIVGQAPTPRSGCQMFALQDGRILVYGGYYREKVKKDYDKGSILIDMYILTPDSKYLIYKSKPFLILTKIVLIL